MVEETINTWTPAIIECSYTETKPRRYLVIPWKRRRGPLYLATEKCCFMCFLSTGTLYHCWNSVHVVISTPKFVLTLWPVLLRSDLRRLWDDESMQKVTAAVELAFIMLQRSSLWYRLYVPHFLYRLLITRFEGFLPSKSLFSISHALSKCTCTHAH